MRRVPALLALLAGLVAAALTGCDSERAVPFFDPAAPATLREERTPGSYRLRRPVVGVAADLAFYLEYQGEAAGRVLRLLSPEGEVVAERRLIDMDGGPGRLLVQLPPERPFSRVVIEPPPGEELAVRAAGLAPAEAAFSAASGTPLIGPQIRSWRRSGQSWELSLEEQAGSSPDGVPDWRLEVALECRSAPAWARFRAAAALADALGDAPGETEQRASAPLYRGPERAAAIITVSDGREERRFLCQGLSGRQFQVLYPALVPFAPRSVRIEPLGGSRLWLDRLRLLPGDAADPLPGPLTPLPADPGVVLAYPQEDWRGALYELYSWSRFPRVLIFDTADYAVQSRFFKRLAFFVEKRGYRGRLVPDREMENRHGFNAHDYRAEDLARFFRQAEEERFPLGPEEEQLRAILLANGILKREGTEYAPGDGAVISISRSSGPLLRRHLLTHEAFHGAFFASEAYRSSCLALWDDLSDPEREFWLLFFRWMGYDTDDAYLCANELQAYLFQQERRELGPYFRGVTAGRLLSSYPDRREAVLGLLGDDPGSFERRFDALEQSLIETVGLEGGRVIGLTELEGP